MGRTRRPLRGHFPERRIYNLLSVILSLVHLNGSPNAGVGTNGVAAAGRHGGHRSVTGIGQNRLTISG